MVLFILLVLPNSKVFLNWAFFLSFSAMKFSNDTRLAPGHADNDKQNVGQNLYHASFHLSQEIEISKTYTNEDITGSFIPSFLLRIWVNAAEQMKGVWE